MLTILLCIVVGISDGDTLKAQCDSNHEHVTIRLAGIDAPEKRQDFGQRSKQSLSDLVYRRQVTVETGKTDRYGREVGKVLVGGRDANLEQIRRGLAWHYKAYQREQSAEDRERYAAEEDAARDERRGLWRMPAPTPPWEFRRISSHRGTQLPFAEMRIVRSGEASFIR